MTRITLFSLGLLALAACEPVPAPPPGSDPADRVTPPVDTTRDTSLDATEGALPTGMDDTCRAARFAETIGQPIEGASFEGALKLRILRPGELFSEDYVPDRLNVGVSRGGTIFRLWCG